jgi:hypothetical protein
VLPATTQRAALIAEVLAYGDRRVEDGERMSEHYAGLGARRLAEARCAVQTAIASLARQALDDLLAKTWPDLENAYAGHGSWGVGQVRQLVPGSRSPWSVEAVLDRDRG